MMKHAVIVSALYIVPMMAHYAAPPDMCALSKLCNHTWEVECGVEKDDKTPKLFLDECDRFEYSCDTKKYFVEAERTACPNICTQTANGDNLTVTTLPSSVPKRRFNPVSNSTDELNNAHSLEGNVTEMRSATDGNETKMRSLTERELNVPQERSDIEGNVTDTPTEAKDFYKVLKERFGDRVRLMRDTTHFPKSSTFVNDIKGTIRLTGGTTSVVNDNDSRNMSKKLKTLFDLYQKMYNE